MVGQSTIVDHSTIYGPAGLACRSLYHTNGPPATGGSFAGLFNAAVWQPSTPFCAAVVDHDRTGRPPTALARRATLGTTLRRTRRLPDTSQPPMDGCHPCRTA